MKKFLFFAYRDWAIDLFKEISSNSDDQFILMTNKNLCTEEIISCIDPNIVFFYGWSWMVPSEIIKKHMCLCLHPSPLPKYRGGSPIQNQLLNDERYSAVTIFKMDDETDTGPICFQERFSLDGNIAEIFEKVKNIGTIATEDIIYRYKNYSLLFFEQNEAEATFFKRLKPSNSEIHPEDFSKYDAKYFYNKVRGLQKPYPEAFIKCKYGKIILKEISYESEI